MTCIPGTPPGITLINDDWRNHLDVIAAADALITDPPYGMDYRSNCRKRENRYESIAGDDSANARDDLLDVWGDRPALMFGTWRLSRPECKNTIAWVKTGNGAGIGDLKIPWGHSWEEIYVIGGGWVHPYGRIPNWINHPTFNAQSKNRPDHPTPKPVGLMEWLIMHCPPEWKIVDPFCGSGATLRAAANLGREAVGIEVDPKYSAVALEWLQKDMAKGEPLF